MAAFEAGLGRMRESWEVIRRDFLKLGEANQIEVIRGLKARIQELRKLAGSDWNNRKNHLWNADQLEKSMRELEGLTGEKV